MKAYGNGSTATCVQNLCSLTSGEVYGDRVRGISTKLTDRKGITGDLVECIQWLIREYEPRADTDSITVRPLGGLDGDFTVDVQAKKRGG